MKTNILLVALILWSYSATQAQSINQTQYAAYLKAGKVLWERSIDLAQNQYGMESFEATVASYGLLNNTMATQDEASFDAYIDQVVDDLKEIIKSKPKWGDPKAVLSAVYGLKIAYSPMKGMIYGSKSASLIESAMNLQPESALVQKLHGSYKLYTPTMFGGDPKEAVSSFTMSVKIFEQGIAKENWLYLDALVGLAMSYKKNDQQDLAIEVLEKAIEIEPDFFWAKSILSSYQNK